MNENYYHILGLDNYASTDAVKQAYRKMAKKYHPDRHPDQPDYEEKFKRISLAYKTLSDKQKKADYDSKLSYQQYQAKPRYTPRRKYYTTEKKQYTPMAWMYGKIFIIALIMAVILIPIYLLYQSSVRYFERAEEHYQQGNTVTALLNYNKAITLFGGRSVQAGIRASEIALYELEDYEQTRYFATKGLKYAEKDSNLAYLHFLRGIAYYGLNKPEKSLHEYHLADSLNYNQDSIQLKMGFVNAFLLEDFQEAQRNFNYLIDRNIQIEIALFGKAWCLQQQENYGPSLNTYNALIKENSQSGLAFYYRSEVLLHMQDTAAACFDLEMALERGYGRASDRYKRFCQSDTTKADK
ncbi:MAG: DnaJ domain-containing protein [Fulvivirga sp.]|nr:DnaJ domain-containing protein [Fulvivirga sp.]